MLQDRLPPWIVLRWGFCYAPWAVPSSPWRDVPTPSWRSVCRPSAGEILVGPDPPGLGPWLCWAGRRALFSSLGWERKLPLCLPV